MNEVSINVSPSASTSSFKSLESTVPSIDDTPHNLIIPDKSENTSLLKEFRNDFLKHNSQPVSTPPTPITPLVESEQFTGVIQELMNENSQPVRVATLPTPITPLVESEQLTSELQKLMNENSQPVDADTPLEETAVEDSLTEMKINSDDNFWLTDEWRRKERHVFILSSAGKPIYSRYGCEDKLATLFGVMQALVSVVQDTEDDRIQSIRAGDMYFSFLSKGYIIVVSVCKHRHGDETLLQRQLLYIYNQILSTINLSHLTRIFDQHRNFDLRRLLSGSERLIHTLVEFTETQVDFVLSSYRCLGLAASTRDQISAVLSSACSKIKNLVFIVLIGNNRVISYLHMKKYHLRPMDIHLILNLVQSSKSFKTAEIWTPLCLPQFDASGYLYSHVSYLADDCPACLLMLTVDENLFFTLSEAKKVITEKLRCAKLLDEINTALASSHSLLTSHLNITSLRHFVYKCKQTSQLIMPQYEPPYSVVASPSQVTPSSSDVSSSLVTPSSSALSSTSYSVAADSSSPSLLEYYSRIYCDIHRSSRHLKLYYQTRDTETLLGWTTADFELYLIFEPLITKPSATNAVNKLLRWVKKEEEKLFMLNNYTL